MAATDKPAGFRWMPAALALSFLPVFLHSYVINCRHCFSGGTCFNIDQVVMYNVTKCYRSVCRPSRIIGKPPMVQIEDVADCQQCCQHGGDIFAEGFEIFIEQDNCTKTCTGQDTWTGCGPSASTTPITITATTPVTAGTSSVAPGTTTTTTEPATTTDTTTTSDGDPV